MSIKVFSSVEVRCLEGDFVSIDFGDFAITVFKEMQGPRIVVSQGEKYEGDYWGFLCSLHDLPFTIESREIKPEHFKEIQYIVQELSRPTQKQFRELMINISPDCATIFDD